MPEPATTHCQPVSVLYAVTVVVSLGQTIINKEVA